MDNSNGKTQRKRYESPATAVMHIETEGIIAATGEGTTNVTVNGFNNGGSIGGGKATPSSSGAKSRGCWNDEYGDLWDEEEY